MDDQEVISEVEEDEFEQGGRLIRADAQDLRWVSLGFQVDNGERMLESMAYVVVGDAVPVGGGVDLHTHLS